MFGLTSPKDVLPCRTCDSSLHEALTRKGNDEVYWEVETHNDQVCQRCNRKDETKYQILFTKKEWARMEHILVHGSRTSTKPTQVAGNCEQSAQISWPSGSVEDVAMRHFGVWVATRYFSSQVTYETTYLNTVTKVRCIQVGLSVLTLIGARLRDMTAVKHFGCLTMLSILPSVTYNLWLPHLLIFAKNHELHWVEELFFRCKPTLLKVHKKAEPPNILPKAEDGVKDKVVKTSADAELVIETPKFDPETDVVDWTKNDGGPAPPLCYDMLHAVAPLPGAGVFTDEELVSMRMPPAPGLDLPISLPLTPRSQGFRECLKNTGMCEAMPATVFTDPKGSDPSLHEHVQIRSARYAESLTSPVVYANCTDNVLSAKKERIDSRQLPYKGTKLDAIKISAFVHNAMYSKPKESTGKKGPVTHDWGVFERSKIEAWVCKNLHYEEVKSGKWTSKRLQTSLEGLCRAVEPKYKCKAAIKAEPMVEGKAPRLLIADGDDGQLMALIVVKCFEDLLFDHFGGRSIKHMSKEDAISNICDRLRMKKGAQVIEGDGSAWDTCNNADVRALVENPVLEYISMIMQTSNTYPIQWGEAHNSTNSKKELKIFFKSKYEKLELYINNIRRSGHRGTSCLNWWMNFVLWCVCLYKNPSMFLSMKTKSSEDNWGEVRWMQCGFEGDDSILSTHAKTNITQRNDDIVAFWTRMGFHMKIFYRNKVAKFCGVQIALKDGVPLDKSVKVRFIPELTRCLNNFGVTCSKSCVDYATGVSSVVPDQDIASALTSKALGFAGKVPTLSRKIMSIAETFGKARLDREGLMQHYGVDDLHTTDVEGIIRELNDSVLPSEELETLARFGYETFPDELLILAVNSWNSSVPGFGGIKEISPLSWREDTCN